MLGQQYSPHLELQDNHKLIRSGPYRLVRHPMYAFLFVYMLGVSLISSNILVIIPHAMAIAILCFRLDKEEAMLVEEFGQDFKDYMLETGRLVPKLR